MSRVIKSDFESLLKFIEEYSLSSFKDDKNNSFLFYHKSTKKYYAYLALISELNNITKKDGTKLLIDKQKGLPVRVFI